MATFGTDSYDVSHGVYDLSIFCCLSEGVQLLCLIDKAADACRYLQTYGEWNRAAWLAKVTQHDGIHQQDEDQILSNVWIV